MKRENFHRASAPFARGRHRRGGRVRFKRIGRVFRVALGSKLGGADFTSVPVPYPRVRSEEAGANALWVMK
ncbi:unnamed protein product, partial [Iphiclides podalirius]